MTDTTKPTTETSLFVSEPEAFRSAVARIPRNACVLIAGSIDDALLSAIGAWAGHVQVHPIKASMTRTRPDLPSESYDLVVLSRVLNGPGDPVAWIDWARRCAPRVWADFTVSDESDEPLAQLTEAPYPQVSPPRALAIDWFERLGLVADVATERPHGEQRCELGLVSEHVDPSESLGDPLLVHVHLPKNGGTTIGGLLDRSFGDAHLQMYDEDPRAECDPHRIRASLYRHHGIRAISSHSFREFPPEIGGRPALYFSVLRDPGDRILSYMRYCQKNWDELSAAHKRQLPEDFRDMDVVAYLRWQASRMTTSGAISANLQCQYFCRPTTFRSAQRILRKFFFIGITDRMTLSIAVLRKKLEPWGIHLDNPPAERANTTSEFYQKTAGATDDPELRAFMKGMQDDRDLLMWATARLEREAKLLGVSDPG
jgi:hypothetical protein